MKTLTAILIGFALYSFFACIFASIQGMLIIGLLSLLFSMLGFSLASYCKYLHETILGEKWKDFCNFWR